MLPWNLKEVMCKPQHLYLFGSILGDKATLPVEHPFILPLSTVYRLVTPIHRFSIPYRKNQAYFCSVQLKLLQQWKQLIKNPHETTMHE